MGLSGRKEKQRIPNDPRNLSWADNAARFGQAYLSKFGWDSSKGLGASGEGRLSHIKVSHKLDMLGIGAAQQKDPNGIAWKQNRDFENLLARLNNEGSEETASETQQTFIKETITSEETEDTETKKRKRKDHTEKKEKKRRKEVSAQQGKPQDPVEEGSTAVTLIRSPIPVKRTLPRHKAHRARAMAAKNMASVSSAAMSEILGISPSATPSSLAETPTSTPLEDSQAVENLSTSKMSVSDYFKDRLSSKAKTLSTSTSHVQDEPEDYEDAPRGGLGSARVKIDMFTTPNENKHTFGAAKILPSMSMLESAVDQRSAELEDSDPKSEETPETDEKLDKAARKALKKARKEAKKDDKARRKAERTKAL